MGEFATLIAPKTRRNPKGIEFLCKLGKMDDWRYVRRQEAKLLAEKDAGAGSDMDRFLRDPATLYRFPWPDEDRYIHDLPHINGRDLFRTWVIEMPEELADVLDGLEHGNICASIGPANWHGFNVNVFVPCPLSIDADLVRPTSKPKILSIYGERYDLDGNGRTIFRCGFCEKPFSMAPDELDRFWADLKARKEFASGWFAMFVDRLKPGKSASQTK